MKTLSAWARILASASLLVACGSAEDGGGSAMGCTEGEAFDCACTDGTTSTQSCQADGTLGACACNGGAPAPSPGPTAAPSPTSTSDPLPDPTTDPTASPPPDPTTTPPDPTSEPPPEPPPPSGGSGCGNVNFPPDGGGIMDVGGVTREYTVTLPPGYDPNTPYKLVFVWHPLGGNQGSVVAGGYNGFEALAAGTAIFATGQGLPFAGGSLAGWGDPNDVPFARQLLDHITQNYCVDEARVFSSGFSFGAIMSNRVGCELGDRIRAIAPMSGSGPAPAPCVGSTAVWISHSDPDPIVPYSSGLESLNYWVSANGCSQDTVPTGVDTCVEYQGCRPEAPLVWCSRTTGGHTPPPYGTGEAWNFFNRF